MLFQITHTTHYRYSQPVTLCHNEVHLRPRDQPGQSCQSNLVTIEPAPAQLHWRTDYFGNPVASFALQQAHQSLTVTATSRVERLAAQIPLLSASIAWEQVATRVRANGSDDTWMARELVLDSPLVAVFPELRDYASPSFASGRPLLEAVADLAARIHHDFAYDPDFTTVSTALSEVLRYRRGVCQDFAHLAIGCLRSLAVPARYVSGYIETLAPPGGERWRGADASHAWVAVWEPSLGWIEIDPTNNQFVAERHVSLAWGRDYSDVTPLKGVVFGGGSHRLDVSVDVTSIGAGHA
ncbi:MAG: transglutaminase family protein [Deltaproteobacteria bacterium]|nr:transglutaminase family protein [Deltaproteobacteria bacterium]